MEILKERFGNRQAVIISHCGHFINLTLAFNNPKSLRLLYDQIEKHLRSLEALQKDISQEVFISMITAKLPKDVLIQLEIQKGDKNKWTVNKWRELFQ